MKIGELLIANGLITAKQLEHALATQKSFGGKLGTNLVELGFVSDKDLAQFLSKQLKLPAAKPADFERIPQNVLDLIPVELASTYKVIPLKLDKRLVVAISDPASLPALDEIQFKTGKAVEPVIAPEIWIVAALERFYHVAREARYVKIEDDEESSEKELSNVYGTFEAGQDAALIGGYIEEATSVSVQSFVD